MKLDKKLAAQRAYGFILGVLTIGIVFGAMVLFVVLFTSTPSTTEAKQYDLNCVAEPIEKPLTDCRR